jgi:8-oxo-dGTP pyrophosphatase MutT (NUDIX family)
MEAKDLSISVAVDRPRCGLCRTAIPLDVLAAGKGMLGGNAFICEDCADTAEGWELVEKMAGVFESNGERHYGPHPTVHGVVFLLKRGFDVLLEECPKKADVLGFPGAFFVPGGKIEPGESELEAMQREIHEELGVIPHVIRRLPLIEGSRVGAWGSEGPRGTFIMRPFIVDVWEGDIPEKTLDGGVPLSWFNAEAVIVTSPVPQVRMIVAGGIGGPFV